MDQPQIPPPPTIRVLVVDDSDSDAEIVSCLLEDSSTGRRYDNERAEDVADALKQLQERGCDIVLLDLGLPDSQGLASVQKVIRHANCPVVVLSGLDDETIAIQSVQIGAQDYLIKDEITARSLEKAILYSIERYALNQKLETATEKANAANQAKTDFLAVMSHEFRTPMNGIIGNLNLLRSLNLPVEANELLTNMEMCANSEMALIGDLLDISRIEAGKLPIEAQTFDPHELIRSSVKIMSFNAKSKGLELLTSIDPSIPQEFVSDQHRLRQVLINLLGNAIKFTEKGEVRLKAQRTQQNELQFSVHDTGIGIRPEDLSIIFEPFAQADSSYERRFNGTGLGLAICKRLVEMMGGKITVESEPGVGSVFRFNIVDLQQQETAPSQQAPEEDSPQPHLSVLLIEDEPLSRNLMVSILKSRGITPLVAPNGHEGIELAQTYNCDLILVDLCMPLLDGFETTKQIIAKLEPQNRQPYITALTASESEDSRLRSLQAGMDDFISKPVDDSDLDRVIDAATRHARKKAKRTSAAISRPAPKTSKKTWPASR